MTDRDYATSDSTKDIESLVRWMERHPEIETFSAFWYCEGVIEGVGYGRYLASVLAKSGTGPHPRRVVATFPGDTAFALESKMEAAGLRVPDGAEIRRLCESAGSNPRLSRRTKAVNDAIYLAVASSPTGGTTE